MTHRITLFLCALILTGASLFAQSPQPGIDYPSPIPTPFIGFTTSTADPGRCYPGLSPINFRTDTAQFKFCSTANTWSLFSGSNSAPVPNSAGGADVGSAALPFANLWLGAAATNNFKLAPAALSAARVITIADPGGAATLAYTNPTTAQALSGLSTLSPATAGNIAIGTAALPFGSVVLGTAATNAFTITPQATSAARTVKLADQGANGAVAFGDQTDPTKIALVDTHSATTATTSTLSFTQGANVTTTMPVQTGGLTTAYFCGATTGTTTCPNTATGGTARVIGGIATLASNSAVISAISPAFTSTSTYACVANDLTTRANPVQIANTSSSSITITNTAGASDVINWVCIGY